MNIRALMFAARAFTLVGSVMTVTLLAAPVAYAAPTCQRTGSTCIEPAGTRIINGIPLYQD
ncbi:conjugal transfer protein TraN, partial [Klebsiella pneumoniae]